MGYGRNIGRFIEAECILRIVQLFQEDIPLQMFVFPVNKNANLDETFNKYLVVPENPAFVSPEDIATKRETWINDWTQVVLR